MILPSYHDSIKSKEGDEWINRVLMRPLAWKIVELLFHTTITPNQITVVSTLTGIIGAVLLLYNTHPAFIAAGIFFFLKDLFDTTDGQLARAKKIVSRRGRFYDSIGDFVVSLCVFAALTFVVWKNTNRNSIVFLGVIAFVTSLLRVSYNVFYQTMLLHRQHRYLENRIQENILAQDISGDIVALRLQKIFLILYGWQDRLMVQIDLWCRTNSTIVLPQFYENKRAIFFTSFIGLATETFCIVCFSLCNAPELYLYCNIFVLNGYWLFVILYRKNLK